MLTKKFVKGENKKIKTGAKKRNQAKSSQEILPVYVREQRNGG